MKRSRLNSLFRAYARDHLSPTPGERDFVAKVYASVQAVIGAANSLQIGSYPRFTAITPMHDLDVLCILGAWNPQQHDPNQALTSLEAKLNAEYENPTVYKAVISRQTHSITIKFMDGEDEAFGVDVVPAYINGANDHGEHMYVVPEIANRAHRERGQLREAVTKGERQMAWIASDPRGYISVASQLNAVNEDFRRAVKFAKGWRASCKAADDDFPLKSFHLEQAITRWVAAHSQADIFDIVFEFFCRLPDFMTFPQIPDRADTTRNIDAYVEELSEADRRKVREARDGFLIKLEEFEEGDDVGELLAVKRRKRMSTAEAYLFDKKIPMLTEQEFGIVGEVLPRTGSFRGFILDKLGLINVDREIRFRLGANPPAADLFKWKVKNADDSPQPRGEITDHGTQRDPEHTKYSGSHYVECFAVRDGVCVARSKQNVVLKSAFAP